MKLAQSAVELYLVSIGDEAGLVLQANNILCIAPTKPTVTAKLTLIPLGG